MPSPADVRRRALLAAAKVTLSLSALACADNESLSSTTSVTPGAGGGQSAAGATQAAGQAGQTAAGQGGSSGVMAGSSGSSGQATGEAGSAGQAAGGSSGAAGYGGSVYALACGLPSDSAPTSETVACCHKLVDAVLPIDPEQPWEQTGWPATLEAPEQACCEVIVTANDTKPADPNAPFDELTWRKASRCCNYIDTSGPALSQTCTPWGPPMPPAMPAHLLA